MTTNHCPNCGYPHSPNYYGGEPRQWQRCPLCDGSGVSRDASFMPSSAIPTRISHPCHGCNGTGMVATP